MYEIGKSITLPVFLQDGEHVALIEHRTITIASVGDFMSKLASNDIALPSIPYGTVAYFKSPQNITTICVMRPAAIWSIGAKTKANLTVFTGVKIPVPPQLYVFRVDAENTILSRNIELYFCSTGTLYHQEIAIAKNWLPNTYGNVAPDICGGDEINRLCGARTGDLSRRITEIIANRETNIFNDDLNSWKSLFPYSTFMHDIYWNAGEAALPDSDKWKTMIKPTSSPFSEQPLIRYLSGFLIHHKENALPVMCELTDSVIKSSNVKLPISSYSYFNKNNQ